MLVCSYSQQPNSNIDWMVNFFAIMQSVEHRQTHAHTRQIQYACIVITKATPTDAIYALQMFVDNDPHHNVLTLFIYRVNFW